MRSGPVDYDRLRELRERGWKNSAIAAELGCSVRTVDGAAKRLGDGKRPPGPRKTVPVFQLWSVWGQHELTKAEVARELGISEKKLAALEKIHKLPPRQPAHRNTQQTESAPDDFGEPEPLETLEFCPWVQKRIAELRLKEKHLEEKRRQEWEPALS